MTKTLTAKFTKPFAKTAALYKMARAGRRFEIKDGRYTVRLARNKHEVETALRLRFEVFNVELAGKQAEPGSARLDFDAYDFSSRHLIVIDRETGRTVGTYRINSIETAKAVEGFYSYNEFSIEDLPEAVIEGGLEAGRACIAADHRNTKVLFLLWKGLATYLSLAGKRYIFGCCSIFSTDPAVGNAAYRQLESEGHLHPRIRVRPRKGIADIIASGDATPELPALFNMYLRIGAKVCSRPMIDHEFGTTDMLVVFDLKEMNPKYKMRFFGS